MDARHTIGMMEVMLGNITESDEITDEGKALYTLLIHLLLRKFSDSPECSELKVMMDKGTLDGNCSISDEIPEGSAIGNKLMAIIGHPDMRHVSDAINFGEDFQSISERFNTIIKSFIELTEMNCSMDPQSSGVYLEVYQGIFNQFDFGGIDAEKGINCLNSKDMKKYLDDNKDILDLY